MEDSTLMTVEFLRARLLSERSVSRTARQRADQLAKKVVELEEQIKIVTLHRKKAEKALAEVLAVLDSHGVNELSECFDLNSDHGEVLSESKEIISSVKDEDQSMTSKSGSEAEVSLNRGRSLSWKSSSKTPDSLKKNFGQARRRHKIFILNGESSTKHRSGKSCRQIRQREIIPTGVDGANASFPANAQENGQVTGSGYSSNHSKNRPVKEIEDSRNKEHIVFSEFPDSNPVDDQWKGVGLHANANDSDRETEMERALEEQAQLIDQYEAEENAQREWEEKFHENNGVILDSYDPGNQSDVNEEKNKLKAESAEPINATPTTVAAEPILSEQEHKPHADASHPTEEPTTQTLSISAPMGMLSSDQIRLHVELKSLPGQQQGRMHVGGHESIFQGPAFPVHEQARGIMEAKQTLRHLRNIGGLDMQSDSKLPSPSSQSTGAETLQMPSSFQDDVVFSGGGMSRGQNQTVGSAPVASNFLGGVLNSSQFGVNFSVGESSGGPKEIVKVDNQKSENMGGVLEALQLAKQSLQHELKRVALSSHGALVAVPDPQIQTIKDANAVEAPYGPAGLFRLPSELQSPYSHQPNYFRTYSDFVCSSMRYGSDSGVGAISSTRHGSDSGIGVISSTRHDSDSGLGVVSLTNHGSDSGVGAISHERYHDSPYMEPALKISSSQRYCDPYLDSARSRMPFDKVLRGHNLNSSMSMPADISPFRHMNFKTRLPSSEELPWSYSDSMTGMPLSGPYSLREDNYRWNVHRL